MQSSTDWTEKDALVLVIVAVVVKSMWRSRRDRLSKYVVVVEVVEVVVLLRKFQSGFLQVVFGMCIINRV